eukprot:11663914-Karenia_brevis.AAC.1
MSTDGCFVRQAPRPARAAATPDPSRTHADDKCQAPRGTALTTILRDQGYANEHRRQFCATRAKRTSAD